MSNKIIYKVFENAITGYILTVKVEDGILSFNHETMHGKEEYETFEPGDLGVELVNNVKMFHLNGKILNPDEFSFLKKILEDL